MKTNGPRWVILMIGWLLGIPLCSTAATLKEAMDEAAVYFTKTAIRIESGQELYVKEVINFHSQKHDADGKKIETELFFAIERQSPDFKLFLGSGQKQEGEIYLTGTYEKKAAATEVKLVISKGGQVLAQKEVVFDNEKAHRKTLIAVLDLEAESMNETQRKAFSDIFRSALSQYNIFDIASSADVDKMDPDQIQEASGCTRDSCATIIGEQLGVDRVISSSMYQVSEGLYVISAKMMDIKEGSILVSKTVNHSGKLQSLAVALEELAFQLTGEKERIKAGEERNDAAEVAKVESRGPSWIWHISALGLTAIAVVMASDQVSQYDEVAARNKELEGEYQNAVLMDDISAIETEQADNKEKMETHSGNVSLYNGFIAVGLLWEAYLIYAALSVPAESDTDQAKRFKPDRVIFQPAFNSAGVESHITFSWYW